jgi:hypothetical protein
MYLFSSPEWSGSATVVLRKSPKTVTASSNETLCLRRFLAALRIPFELHSTQCSRFGAHHHCQAAHVGDKRKPLEAPRKTKLCRKGISGNGRARCGMRVCWRILPRYCDLPPPRAPRQLPRCFVLHNCPSIRCSILLPYEISCVTQVNARPNVNERLITHLPAAARGRSEFHKGKHAPYRNKCHDYNRISCYKKCIERDPSVLVQPAFLARGGHRVKSRGCWVRV